VSRVANRNIKRMGTQKQSKLQRWDASRVLDLMHLGIRSIGSARFIRCP
jgi:hypothetical protein